MQKKKKRFNKVLASMAEDMVYEQACSWLWGEEEVPECLMKNKEELDRKEN